jgi:hypothetical protein
MEYSKECIFVGRRLTGRGGPRIPDGGRASLRLDLSFFNGIDYDSMRTLRKMRFSPALFRLPLLPVVALAFSILPASAAFGESAMQRWQAKAVAEFPSLGVPGSAFNSLFLERVKVLRQRNPKAFQDPSWPYRLAQQVASSPELARAVEMMDSKNRALVEASQAAANSAPDRSIPPQKAEEAGKEDKSTGLAQLCLHALDAELASGALKDARAVWIQEGGIPPRLRVRALRSAKVISEATYSDVLQQFLENVLKLPADLGEEELNWVKAFLADNESHSAFAGLLGLSEVQLVSSLLAKADSPSFTLDWLGGGPGGFAPPMKIPAARRLEILEKVMAAHFQLGGMHLSKDACQAMCFRINSEVAGGGFLLLEQMAVKDFPENCLMNANAPASKFSPLKKEWVAYMKSLSRMHEDLREGKFAAFSTYFPACVGTGGFEQFVVWASLRKDSVRESTLWIDSLAPELYKHAGVQAREARRVLPAINYVLTQQALADARTAPPAASPLPKPAASKPVAVAPPSKPAPAPPLKSPPVAQTPAQAQAPSARSQAVPPVPSANATLPGHIAK